MDFMRGLRHQEGAANKQDDVAPGKALAEKMEDWLNKTNHPCQREQETDAEQECERKTNGASLICLLLRQA